MGTGSTERAEQHTMDESLARKLRVLRAERGWTLNQAAERAGVQPETISDAEHGKRRPYTPTLTKIAKGYGVPIEELIQEPALAGKAEAPASGPSLLERALDAARQDADNARKSINRLVASEGTLKTTSISEYEEDKFRAVLRAQGFPDEYFEDFIWPLVTGFHEARQRVAQVEEENARLKADLAKVKA